MLTLTTSLYQFSILVIGWICGYNYLVKKGIRSEIVFSILSMTHWLIAFLYFFAITAFSLDKCVQNKEFGGDLTQIQLYFHILTCSYYGFDIVAKYFKKQLDTWLTIHHGLTLLFIAIALMYQQSGSENIYILRYSTFCNWPMNIKNILRIKNIKNSKYHWANIFYVIIYSFNFLIMLPMCLQSFYVSNTNMLTFSLLVLLCAQAQLTIIKTLVPSVKRSVEFIINQILVS